MHVSYLAECMKEVANRKKISISFEARDHFSKLTDEWLNISAQLLLYCFSKLRNDQCPVPKGQLRQFSSNKEQDQNFCIYFNKVSPWQFHSTQTFMLYFGLVATTYKNGCLWFWLTSWAEIFRLYFVVNQDESIFFTFLQFFRWHTLAFPFTNFSWWANCFPIWKRVHGMNDYFNFWWYLNYVITINFSFLKPPQGPLVWLNSFKTTLGQLFSD